MSKEQVLKNKLGQTHDCISLYHKDIHEAMQEYSDQQNKELREENKKLKEEVSLRGLKIVNQNFEIESLKQKCEFMSKIIEAHKNYVGILQEELNDVVGMAAIHGWKSKRFEQGKEARDLILQLEQSLNKG